MMNEPLIPMLVLMRDAISQTQRSPSSTQPSITDPPFAGRVMPLENDGGDISLIYEDFSRYLSSSLDTTIITKRNNLTVLSMGPTGQGKHPLLFGSLSSSSSSGGLTHLWARDYFMLSDKDTAIGVSMSMVQICHEEITDLLSDVVEHHAISEQGEVQSESTIGGCYSNSRVKQVQLKYKKDEKGRPLDNEWYLMNTTQKVKYFDYCLIDLVFILFLKLIANSLL